MPALEGGVAVSWQPPCFMTTQYGPLKGGAVILDLVIGTKIKFFAVCIK